MLRIIKRDGRIVEFDKTKIKSAVQKAYVGEDTDKVELSEMIANDVVNRIRSMIKDDDKVYDIDIEDIQDAVEVALMKKHPETAKRYILYRENRSKIRNNKSTINRKIDELIQCSAEESDTKRENANIDGNTTCGSLLQIAGTVSKEYYFNHVSDPKFKMYHDQGVIHLHDSDLSLFTINCLYIPLAKLLKNGFSTGHVYLSTPSNVISAAELTCVIIQSNQNDMFGGQAIANLDYDLAPYVAKSFVRNCAEYLNATLFVSHDWAYTILKEQFVAPLDEYIAKKERIINNEGTTLIKKYFELIVATYHKEKMVDDDFFSNMYNYATFKTEKDTHQGMQALVCNLNSLQSRAGSQTPFSSVNLGLDTSEEGRMITKHLFEITEQGTALNEIFIFPISIFKIHKDTCYPGCKNYDLFKLACKTSAKAEYPNFVNVSAPMNVKYYDPARPETSVASMGCVHGSEVALWKINGNVTLTTFAEMKSYLANCQLISYSLNSSYIDFEREDTELKIWDSHSNDFVDVKKFIINRNVTNWRAIQFTNGRNITATGDHPLPVVNKGRISIDEMCIGDKVPLTTSYPKLDVIDKPNSQIDYYWLLGMIICDAAIVRNSVIISIGDDEVDLLSEIQKHATVLDIYNDGCINVRTKHQERGVKGIYYDIRISGIRHASELAHSFGGFRKTERRIPDFILQNTTREEKLAFLAGMIDADGYVNNRRKNARVQIGSINKILAYGQMFLAEYLGLQAKVYHNHYSSRHDNIRYRVEFFITEELKSYLRSTKKINHSTGFSGVCSDVENAEVMNIIAAPVVYDDVSYDVETESDRFDFSGIQSHNCRTRVLGNAYDPDNAVTSGRGNLFFNTINLPYLALLAKETYPDNEKERYDYFNTLLDEKVHELIKFSHDRFELAARRKAKNFPFLMCQHVYLGSERLLPDDEIREVIKNGSMAIGFIGLAETLVALFGKHHGESEESQKKGIEIISRMKAITDDYSKKEKMNYSIIATPAEGCSGRLLRATRKRFGTVKGVTDREYFTNSVHVPVWFKISAYDKIRLEAPYHPLCEGGIISYIELDYDATKNLEAFESLVLAMAESGMTYFSINHPVDHDPICGYTGYIPIDGKCPRCGRKSEEGVPAGKLLSLRSYNPTPEYAVHYSELEEKDKTTNSINLI